MSAPVTDHERRWGVGAQSPQELEEERRFLLRSLADLEREHDAGDIEDADYVTLRDGYTVRAASVLRAIEAGRVETQPAPRRNWWRVVGGVAAVVAAAAALGLFVARSSGQRLPGQEITGGAADDVAVKLAQARLLLGTDQLAAFDLYNDVLEEDPDQPEALAYSGWLLAITSRGASDDVREAALETATASLRQAVEVDPGYADPHCFLAIIAANMGEGTQEDAATARTEADACLANEPPAEMRQLVEQFVLDVSASVTEPP
jgi:hypothetical protein